MFCVYTPLSMGVWGGGRSVGSMHYSLRGQTFHFHSISSSWGRILFEFKKFSDFQIFQNSWFWPIFFSFKGEQNSETHTQASLDCWLSESEVSEFCQRYSGLQCNRPNALPKSWKSWENPLDHRAPREKNAAWLEWRLFYEELVANMHNDVITICLYV